MHPKIGNLYQINNVWLYEKNKKTGKYQTTFELIVKHVCAICLQVDHEGGMMKILYNNKIAWIINCSAEIVCIEQTQ